MQNSINSLKKFVRNEKTSSEIWIAFCNNEPFGYLITSIVDDAQVVSNTQISNDSQPDDEDCPLSRWIEPGKKMITLDLLIGDESYLGLGLSTRMIKEFLADKFSDADIIFIDPELSNTKAIHVYEKVGFTKLNEFIASWHPVLHLMMRLKVVRSQGFSIGQCGAIDGRQYMLNRLIEYM